MIIQLLVTILNILSIVLLVFIVGKISIFFIFSWLHYRGYSSNNRTIYQHLYDNQILVSIIIPAFNEEKTLAYCVESILAQEYPFFEVLIIDDGSTDNTLQVAQALAEANPCVQALSKINGGKSSALNWGISKCSGEYIICVDADTMFVPTTVSSLLQSFNNPRVAAVCGNIKVANRDQVLTRQQALEYIAGLNMERRSLSFISSMLIISGAIGAFRKNAVLDVGGYSSDTLVEDMDITLALLSKGYKVVFNGEAVAYTESPGTISNFYKQRYRWYFGFFQVMRKYAKCFGKTGGGMFGWFGLPYSLLYTFFDLLVSFFFIYNLLRAIQYGMKGFLIFATVMASMELVICLYVFFIDRENKKLLLLLPLQYLWYRHLLAFITIKALWDFVIGRKASWNKFERMGKNRLTSVLIQKKLFQNTSDTYTWQTVLIAAALTLLIFCAYILSFILPLGSPLFNLIIISIVVDGLFLFLHLPRKYIQHDQLYCDSSKLTIMIACYNGESVIGETISHALRHVPPNQVVVVSDCSTDNTEVVAKSFGVRVFRNERNVNKAFSISQNIDKVYTPYVLILDDDTLVGDTVIPTNLLDKGYSAVAFKVMPVKTGKLINILQIFEYRKSMYMSKALRAAVGAVGNISGAIGLYRTVDLKNQAILHSGQFGGEDQQRTSLVHLNTQGSGIGYTDEIIETHAPDSWKAFLRQRSFRWNLATPELFAMNVKILLHPKLHYLLKIEKGIQIYMLLTDPLRMLFIWSMFTRPIEFVYLYTYYLILGYIVWVKLGRRDPLWVPLVFPFFTKVLTLCRFIAHFYWFRIKYIYLFKKKFQRLVPGRSLALEYMIVVFLIFIAWSGGVYILYSRFRPEINRFSVWNSKKVSGELLTYAIENNDEDYLTSNTYSSSQKEYDIVIRKGWGQFHVARVAIATYLEDSKVSLKPEIVTQAERILSYKISNIGRLYPDDVVRVEIEKISISISEAKELYVSK